VLSTDFSLVGSLLQQAEPGAAETGASTLVELGSESGSFALLSDAAGSFSFRGIPSGNYVLFIWWSPGFVDVATSPTNPALYWAGISVGADGTVRGELPSQILLNPNTTGAVPYPVRTGTGTLPIGTLNIGVRPVEQPSSLPETGTGRDDTWWPVAAGVALLLAVASAVIVVGVRRAKAEA
jgi:hypothetical protein